MSQSRVELRADSSASSSSAHDIEPRLLQRRLAVERQQARRRRRLLGGAVACAAAAAAAVGIARSPVVDVDRVEVAGAASTPVSEIERVTGFDHHPAMLDVDPNHAARAIETLPWVARARVVRHWPATLEVTVLERSAAAAVPAGERGWVVVDTTGRILATDPDPPAELLRLTTAVPPGNPGERLDATSRGALHILNTLPAPLHGRVTGVATTTEAVTLTVDGRIAVDIGPPTDVNAKLIALTTLLQRADTKGVKAIDVRVPTAPVLTR